MWLVLRACSGSSPLITPDIVITAQVDLIMMATTQFKQILFDNPHAQVCQLSLSGLSLVHVD